jgi:hypothetical protein
VRALAYYHPQCEAAATRVGLVVTDLVLVDITLVSCFVAIAAAEIGL